MKKKNLIILTIIGILILIGLVSSFIYFLDQREAETPEVPVPTQEEPEAIEPAGRGSGGMPLLEQQK